MKSCWVIIAFASLVLGALFLSGCGVPLPDNHSWTSAVYPRVNQNNVTNEVIIVAESSFAWVALTVEGGQALGNGYTNKTFYYFSDRYVRRRPLRFLEAPNTGHWELFSPVDGTNCWVRVLGPSDHFSRYTNTVVITVFTPRKLLHQQNIETMDFPTRNYLRFTDGNRIVAYKSENDEFVYNVLENSLDKKRAK